ncbi:MAG: hypothetical protein RPT25_11760 [Cycloclasticus sp.]|jgi:hypothetical protein
MNKFAPEYTKKERVNFIIKTLLWAAPLFAVTKFWFFPWFENYAENPHCYDYGYFTGVQVVFYGTFVFMPLMFAVVFFMVDGRRSLKVIKLGQNPLPEEKVFKKTAYSYGAKAKVKPFIMLFFIVFLVLFSIYGYFSATEIIISAEDKVMPVCE